MKASVKRSLLFASLLGLVSVAGVSVTGGVQANAATHATMSKTAKASKKSVKVVSNKYMSSVSQSKRNVRLTGEHAIYSWIPGTGKVQTVASKTTAGLLAKSKLSQSNFRVYKQAVTNNGTVYFKVVTFDKAYRGWIYGGKSVDRYAGGIKADATVRTATAPDANNVYRLMTPKANQVKTLLYKAPAFTDYKIGVIKNVDATKLANVNFTVQGAKTRTREGDVWYQVKSSDKNIDGSWVKISDLRLVSGKDSQVVADDSQSNSGWNTDSSVPSDVTQANSTRIAYINSDGQMVGTYRYFTTSSKDTKVGDKVGDNTTKSGLTLRQEIQSTMPQGFVVTGSVDTSAAVFGGTVKVNVTTGQASKLSLYADSKTGFTSSNSDDQFVSEAKTDTIAAPSNVSNANLSDLEIALNGDNSSNISDSSLSSIQSLAKKVIFNSTLSSDTSKLPTLAYGVSATDSALQNIAGQQYAVGTKTFTRSGHNYHYIYVANNVTDSSATGSFLNNNRTAKYGDNLKNGVTIVAVDGNAPTNSTKVDQVLVPTITATSNTND